MVSQEFCITAKDLYKMIRKKYPSEEKELKTERIAFIVFPSSTITFLKENTNMKERDWLMDTYSFYAYPTKMWVGKYKAVNFNVVQPPMGDSGTAAIIEQLIACGTEIILLVCGAWGLKDSLQIGDICIPTISIASNRIANSYGGNNEIKIEESLQEIIFHQLKNLGLKYSYGTNVAFESFYRISKKELENEKKKKIISAENGELHTLLSIGNEFGIKTGAIFYNYFMPLKKLTLDTPPELYKKGGENIGKIALNMLTKI